MRTWDTEDDMPVRVPKQPDHQPPPSLPVDLGVLRRVLDLLRKPTS